jgi:hypothetical protein
MHIVIGGIGFPSRFTRSIYVSFGVREKERGRRECREREREAVKLVS